MTNKPLFTQIGTTTLGRSLAAILQAVSLILIARSVDPGQFGLLSAVVGAAWVSQTIFDMGTSTFILRERANLPQSGRISSALHMNNRSTFVFGTISVILLGILGFTFDKSFLFMIPLALWMSAERNAEAWLGVAFADGDWKVNFINMVAKRLLAAVLLILLLLSPLPPLLSFSLSWSIPAIASVIAARRYVSPSLPPMANISSKEIVGLCWPYWLTSISTQLSNMDVTVAGLAGSSYQAGIFATASRLTSPLRILPTSMAHALLPAAARSTSPHDKHRLLRLSGIVLLCISLLYLCLYLAVPKLLTFVLDEEYANAATPLQVVLLGLPFAAGTSLFNAHLQAYGDKKFVAAMALVSSLTYLSVLPILVATFGATGASYGLTSSFVIQFLGCSARYGWLEMRERNDPTSDTLVDQPT